MKTDENDEIAILNFSKFSSGSDEDRLEFGKQMIEVYRTLGFVYLSQTGLREDIQRDSLFAQVKRFFQLPNSLKDSVAWDLEINTGYVATGREKVTLSTDLNEIEKLRQTQPDLKESFEIGPQNNRFLPESDLPGFKEDMTLFFEECHLFYLEVIRSLALGLGLDEEFFVELHSDYGMITLLFQDDVGGLEVQHPDSGKFIPVRPIPNTIVVNVGDLLSRWTNGILKSTLHQVVSPTLSNTDQEEFTPQRNSIAFFTHPDRDTIVEGLPLGDSSTIGSAPIRAGDYLQQRLVETYHVADQS